MQLALLIAMLKSAIEGVAQVSNLIEMIGEGREPTTDQVETARARTKALSDRIDAIVASHKPTPGG